MRLKIAAYASAVIAVAALVVMGPLQAGESALKVGIYPYVPRPQQFKTAIQTSWEALHPDVELVFDDTWDGGYDMTPPDDLDVFVFDAMMLENFRASGYLEPMQASEVKGLDDFISYAINGVKYGDQYVAIPQLGCASILFYKKNDAPIATAKDIGDLKTALGQCTYTSQVPPDVRGMMIDMQGGSTNAALYLDIAHSYNGRYPLPLPPTQGDLNATVIGGMKTLLTTSSFWNATQSPSADYGRGAWFSQGYGRVLVGYTEHMSAMSPQTRSQIGFKPLPMADSNHPPLFYADVIGVNTKTNSRGTRALAVELANLMASTATMVASIGPGDDQDYPQYLMATRKSIFQQLGANFPIYNDMYAMVQAANPVMFKLSSDSRTWLNDMKNVIRSQARSNYACGCDHVAATMIGSNSMAPAICTPTCAAYGGWNGQWTNAQPAAPAGKSVCGCNSCNMP